MSVLLLLVSLAAAGPAGPEETAFPTPATFADRLPTPPTAKEVEGWDVARYNDFLVDNQLSVVRELGERIRAFAAAGEATSLRSYVASLREVVHGGRANARLLPPYRGDARFRDAILDVYDLILRMLERDLPAFWALIEKPEVRNADLAAAEAALRGIIDDSERGDRAVRDAQAAFARAHGLVLLESEKEEKIELPEFSAPNIPPAGSVLGADVHVSFALRYHNALVGRQVALAGAMNGLMEAGAGDADAFERARTVTLAAVRSELAALRRVEDWQGDDSLRAATIALGEGLEALLDGDFATYTALRRKVRLTQEEADRHNQIGREVSPRFQALLEGFTAAQVAFLDRWGIAAYEAWRASRPPPSESP